MEGAGEVRAGMGPVSEKFEDTTVDAVVVRAGEEVVGLLGRVGGDFVVVVVGGGVAGLSETATSQ